MSQDEKGTTVFVVVCSIGEYSDRYEWVAGVFTSRDEAISIAEERDKSSKAHRAAYDKWCERSRARFGFFSNVSWEEKVFVLGKAPSGESFDELTIYEVPLGRWGRWDDFNLEQAKGKP